MAVFEHLESFVKLRVAHDSLDGERGPGDGPPAAPGPDIVAGDQPVGLGTDTVRGDDDVSLEPLAVGEDNSGLLLIIVVVHDATLVLDLDPDPPELRDQHPEQLRPAMAVHARR